MTIKINQTGQQVAWKEGNLLLNVYVKDTAHIFLFGRRLGGGDRFADAVELKEKRQQTPAG